MSNRPRAKNAETDARVERRRGKMRVEPVSGRVLGGPLEDVYVYEAPVRVWHWVTMLCFIVLGATGYLIGSPLPSIGGEATHHFTMGWIRMIHFTTGWILAVAFLVRVYWVFAGNEHARAIFVPPVWSVTWWKALFLQIGEYLFLRKDAEVYTGHNPLAQIAMFAMFVVGVVVLIVTGFGLYAQQHPWGTPWMNALGWVTSLFGGAQAVRTVHHFAFWYVALFALVHMYMVFRQDIMSGATIVSTMVNGIRKFKPRRSPS
jgi:Ni/Fe-hydrogenase 1 B-type cytochrome subunit